MDGIIIAELNDPGNNNMNEVAVENRNDRIVVIENNNLMNDHLIDADGNGENVNAQNDLDNDIIAQNGGDNGINAQDNGDNEIPLNGNNNNKLGQNLDDPGNHVADQNNRINENQIPLDMNGILVEIRSLRQDNTRFEGLLRDMQRNLDQQVNQRTLSQVGHRRDRSYGQEQREDEFSDTSSNYRSNNMNSGSYRTNIYNERSWRGPRRGPYRNTWRGSRTPFSRGGIVRRPYHRPYVRRPQGGRRIVITNHYYQ